MIHMQVLHFTYILQINIFILGVILTLTDLIIFPQELKAKEKDVES